jgi:hypothetical protein
MLGKSPEATRENTLGPPRIVTKETTGIPFSPNHEHACKYNYLADGKAG